MLSEATKTDLRDFIQWVRSVNGLEVIAKDGPAYTVNLMRTASKKRGVNPLFYSDLESNTKEAEQYLAALIGMM